MNLPDALKHLTAAVNDMAAAWAKIEAADAALTNDPKVAEAISDGKAAFALAKEAAEEIAKAIADL